MRRGDGVIGVKPIGNNDPAKVGPYNILSLVGAGGMARVYLGRHNATQEYAAVKVMNVDADEPDMRMRFKREVELAWRVNSYYTADILAADPTALHPWYSSEYIVGPSVEDAIKSIGRGLDEGAATTLTLMLFEALEGVHAQGIVHRDLKPSNMILGPDGLRLIDFGIAHLVDQTRLTHKDEVIGSAGYLSPEAYRGVEPAPARDIFAFGAVVVYAASGHPAFAGPTRAAIFAAVMQSPPDLSGVPVSLHPLAEICLAKDPAQRPDLASIRPYLPGSPPAKVHGTAWLPSSVAAQVTQQTNQLRALSTHSPTRPDTQPSPAHTPSAPAYTQSPPAPPPSQPVAPPPRRVRPKPMSVSQILAEEAAKQGVAPVTPTPPARVVSARSTRRHVIRRSIAGLAFLAIVAGLAYVPIHRRGPGLPVPTFTAATTIRAAFLRERPAESVTVTKVEQDNFYLKITTEIRPAAMAEQVATSWCAWVKGKQWSGRLVVEKLAPDTTTGTTVLTTSRIRLQVSGQYSILPDCDPARAGQSAVLGTAEVKNLGLADDSEDGLVTVVSAFRSGRDLKVVMAYQSTATLLGCADANTTVGQSVAPVKYDKRKEKGATFMTATFKALPTGSKLYLRHCTGQDVLNPYKGNVVTLP